MKVHGTTSLFIFMRSEVKTSGKILESPYVGVCPLLKKKSKHVEVNHGGIHLKKISQKSEVK